MPEISGLIGIIIPMYVEPSGPHHRPQLHAYYQEYVGVYAIDEIERLVGSLPFRQERLEQKFIRKKSTITGMSCSPVVLPVKLSH